MSADDNAPEQAREVEVVGIEDLRAAWKQSEVATWPRSARVAVTHVLQVLDATEKRIAAERQEAAREALIGAATHARHALNTAPSISGYDRETVAVWLLDRADGVTGRSGT